MLRASSSSRSFWLTILAITVIINLASVWSSYVRWNELGVALTRSVWGLVFLGYLGIIAASAWLFVSIDRSGGLLFDFFSNIRFFDSDTQAARILSGLVFLSVLVLIPYVKFTFRVGWDDKNPVLDPALLSIFYYWMCWYALLIAMIGMKMALRTSWQVGFVSALVVLGVVYETWTRFNAVTTYPLSMGWSEGSRYYYASLYFSKSIYGEFLPLPTLHPSRYLLQSIPFLIPSLGIAVHRFWQFLLWIGLTSGASILLAKRTFSSEEKVAQWLFAGWAFLFFMCVGVYYHLQIMVILPLLFVTQKHPWQSLIAVILASVWAGISRVNWFPVPAMIAIAIYLLETPLRSANLTSSSITFRQIRSYFTQPALWAAVGLTSALLAQVAYIFISGNAKNADAFASSFVSDLLWYRLWPNPNHFLGILPAILLVSGPLIATLVLAARQRNALHPLRWLVLSLMIGVLFAGSLVVSVKIGGGGDLHNMDAYAILLAVAAAYFLGGRVQTESGESPLKVRSWPALTIAVWVPIFLLLPSLSPYPRYDESRNTTAYQQLTQTVEEVGKNGPVLFINERQLVTFGAVDVPLVPDYEAVTLMEMAMSNNQVYLDRFYHDLESHRFAAIVAVKQNTVIKQTGAAMEENNVWNSRVSPYILCYYHAVLTVEPQSNRVEVYVPSAAPTDCPATLSAD